MNEPAPIPEEELPEELRDLDPDDAAEAFIAGNPDAIRDRDREGK